MGGEAEWCECDCLVDAIADCQCLNHAVAQLDGFGLHRVCERVIFSRVLDSFSLNVTCMSVTGSGCEKQSKRPLKVVAGA